MQRVTPSLVLSTIAIVMAGTAGASAATKLITGKQVKNSSLTGADIRNGSLTARDIRDGTISADELDTDLIDDIQAPGTAGPQGVPGPQGPAGSASFSVVESNHADVGPSGSATFTAQCPSGQTAVGTGFYSSVADVGFVKIYGSFVGGIMFNDTGIVVRDLHVQAVCAAGSAGAIALRAPRTTGSFQADVNRAQAARQTGRRAGRWTVASPARR